MPKNVAPLKQTAGGGFDFEDKCVAYFLSCLLSAQPPLDPEIGTISRIDFQTRVDGWFLDDILLTLTSHGENRSCALSVKSNQQFTKSAAPSEFVSLAWEQFLHEGTTRFDKSQDLLGLIIAPLLPKLYTKLSSLLVKARVQDSKDLPHRLEEAGYVSGEERRLFNSFACPNELAKKHGITKANTGELLKCIVVPQFDFELESSTRLPEAIRNCRDVLRSGSPEEALFLWKDLLHIAKKYRNYGGYLDLCKLVALLRSSFRLKEYPVHQEDWAHLLNQTDDSLEVIPDKIGDKVFLPRNDEFKALKTAFTKSKAVVIVGPSGCGKTVIAKSWAEKELSNSKIIWWNAGSLDVEDFAAFESKLRLVYPLKELLAAATDPCAYMIIDGLDRVFSEGAFQNLSVLIHTLRLNIDASPWRILITCQPEEWSRIQMQLSSVNVLSSEWETIEIKEPNDGDLDPVWGAFPALRRLKLQPQLRSLLFKPKVLDLLATKLSLIGSVDTTDWVGESDLIEWFWEVEVRKQPNATERARFLKLLGGRQADNLESETPEDEFSGSDLTQVDSLEQDRLCGRHEERLYFYHDLYGDWARQRILIGRANNLREYLEPRIASPLWHRAVRLYGLHLLERNADITQWRSALIALGSGEDTPNLAQDILLEAAIFAANPLPIFERLWPDLLANDGLLLHRLLGRFLHVATLPNPGILAAAKTLGMDLEIEAATIRRIPYLPYWIPMIQFLHGHLADVVELVPEQVAKISDTWLREGLENWPLRQEAAELALETAEWNHVPEEIFYRAALAGARELPDRVAAFALEASARREHLTQEPESRGETKCDVSEIFPPWPDGPSRCVDSTFRKICLKTDALYPLIRFSPSVAREVLLALLIEEPRVRDPFEYISPIQGDLGIEYVQEWDPPFYTCAPLLFFMKNQLVEGLEVVLRLVSFATERWVDRWKDQHQILPEVIITLPDGEHKWIGDCNVYYWYRDIRCPYPIDPIAAALMALEKYLYDEIDEKSSIDATVELILQSSNSVAFAGLLSAVGRKYPSLFQGILQPLLTVPEFHHWEFQYSLQRHDYLMGRWWNQGEQNIGLAREWHALTHRMRGLHELAQWLFWNVPQMRPFFEQARSNWSKQLTAVQEGDKLKDYLEQLVAIYDIRNYNIRKHPEHGDVLVFEPPEELRAKSEKIPNDSEKQLLLLNFSRHCRQILNEGKPLPHESLEEFWDRLQRVSESTLPVDAEPGVVDVKDAVCGGAAVLLQFHCDWLEQHPERREWCVGQLLKTIHDPPKAKRYDSGVDIYDGYWDSFCAQAIPLLWAEEPDLPILRECVALLAASYHYKTVEILFASAANVRSRLCDNFKQLQHFLLRCAAARWKWNLTRHEKNHSFNVETWLQQEVQAFVDKSITPQIPPLDDLSAKKSALKYDRISHRRNHGPDLELIQAAYAWAPSLNQASSETERAEWIAFWKEALGWTLRMLIDETGGEKAIDELSSDWDRWVFDHVAPLIMELRPTERPEEFWKPILSLGTPGHYWIKDFLEYWFINGLRSERGCDVFVYEWRAMVEFAFSSSEWSFDSARSQYHLEEMWCCLMGFDWIISDTQKPIVRQMHDIYERWAGTHLKKPHCAKQFIAFLKQPAAEEILLDGLIWLENAACQAGDQFWSGRGIQEKLASLLNRCWQSHQSNLRRHQTSFGAFKSLLKGLADRQNTFAMELQDRVSPH